jgi:hypothetical protein
LTAVSTPAVFDATTSIRKRILRRVQHTRPRHFLRPEVRTRSPVVARVSSAWLSGARGGRGRGHRWILIQPVHAPCPLARQPVWRPHWAGLNRRLRAAVALLGQIWLSPGPPPFSLFF